MKNNTPFCGAMFHTGARCSSVVRAFAHGAMGCKERDVALWLGRSLMVRWVVRSEM